MNLSFMNIVDVSGKMREGAKSSLAVVTLMWPAMVSLVLPVKWVLVLIHEYCVRGGRGELADELG
jgi:hypothetical protein